MSRPTNHATVPTAAPAAAPDSGLLSPGFEALDAPARIVRAREVFADRLVATTSFGAQSAVLLHLLATHAPDIPVICVDTGYFFAETYQYAEELQNLLGLRVRFYASPVSPARMESIHGRLWEKGADGHAAYGRMRKVEPLDRALREHGAAAWMTGVRRAQSSTRAERTFVERQNRTTKIYPILDWTDAMVEAYVARYQLPPHPLVARGFVSIGDWHSTRKLEPGMNAEETRHNGIHRECGLHLDSANSDFQI